MSLLDPGQAKTDSPPLSGIAGALWTDLSSDPDSTVNAKLADLSPCPGTLSAQKVINRKNLAVGLETTAKAFGLVFSTGNGTIAHGANSVTLTDAKVTTNSAVVAFIVGQPDSVCISVGGVCTVNGQVQIIGLANVNDALGLTVGYFAINK